MGSSPSKQAEQDHMGETSDDEIESKRGSNREFFETLKLDPNFSDFFSFTFSDMVVGAKINEGAQAEIYEGEFTIGVEKRKKLRCVLKIFREGYHLSDLQRSWPSGMLKGGNSIFPGFTSGTSSILGGMVLDSDRFRDRFAIVLRREWGDLKQLIDLRREQAKNKGLPFPDREKRPSLAKQIMLEIAVGMQRLHSHGIVHGDLRAANVLVSTPYAVFPKDIENDAFHVKIFDFESSVGVGGTGFWRAPEILQALKEYRKMLPTTEADVYSYAMTCYEILTGRIPFEGHSTRDYDYVLSERPHLPEDMEKWLRDLILQCWHQDPLQRPEFKDIVDVFKSNFPDPMTHVVEEAIEDSKYHWSELDSNLVRDDPQMETNHQIFARLKKDPQYSVFFSYEFLNLNTGRKIAEGGQAEIFEAEFEKKNGVKVPCVVKLFKQISLLDMVKEWPPGMLQSRGDSSSRQRFGFMGLYPGATRTCEVLGAVVDETSDRFAFILNREGGDLRTWIDDRMKRLNNPSRPFNLEFSIDIMYQIGLGMLHLHEKKIMHRDLKAANILVTSVFGEFPTSVDYELIDVKVADFECSMSTVGTRFWRAPEVLKHVEFGTKCEYTRKADVYSFAITCYEVLTGGVPLDHLKNKDYAAVYERGERPILPDDIGGDTSNGWLRALIERCWHLEPSERPEFKEIIEEFEKNCSYLRHDS